MGHGEKRAQGIYVLVLQEGLAGRARAEQLQPREGGQRLDQGLDGRKLEVKNRVGGRESVN